MPSRTPIEKVSLSFVCEKDWQKMTSCSNGKFCLDCNKTIINFTNKSLEDLHQTLQENKHACGRFFKSQFAPRPVQLPFSLRNIAVSVVIAAGLSVFSKEATAQTNNCNTLDHDHKKVQSEATFGMILQTHPVFKFGGDTALASFVQKNMKQPPSETLKGPVVTSFIIDAEGEVQDPEIIKSPTPWVDNKTIRIAKLLEFIPSMQDDKNVTVKYTLPVRSNRKRSEK